MSVARRTIPWHAGCFTKSWEATRPAPAPQSHGRQRDARLGRPAGRDRLADYTRGLRGGIDTVERIDTRSSVVFLVGDRAFKLKRAVHSDYLNYSSVERRREC